MTTGMHVVADISCARCLNVVGWKYVSVWRAAGWAVCVGWPAPLHGSLNQALPDSVSRALITTVNLAVLQTQEAAHETSQKYKEGKFIIERIHVVESSSRDSSTGSPRSPPRFAFQPARHPLGDSSSASETGSF